MEHAGRGEVSKPGQGVPGRNGGGSLAVSRDRVVLGLSRRFHDLGCVRVGRLVNL